MRKLPTILAVVALMIVVWLGSAALASEKPTPERSQAAQQITNEARQFSEEVGSLVGEALNFSDAEQYPEAISVLNNTLIKFELSPYETSIIHQMIGASLYEIDDYDGAITAFENAISSGGLLPKEASNLRVNIAQLLIAYGKYEQGAQMFEDWAADGGVFQPKYIEYLWQAWSQAEQYDRALPWAEKWFENANPKQRKHYDLLYFIYRELEMRDKCTTLIMQMHAIWPDDESIGDADFALNNKESTLHSELEPDCK